MAVEVDRVVNASGLVSLAGRYVSAGQALAGHRVTLRLDGDLAHVIDDGVLVRTLPAPAPVPVARAGACMAASRRSGEASCGCGAVTSAATRVQPRSHPGRRAHLLRVGYAHRPTLTADDQ